MENNLTSAGLLVTMKLGKLTSRCKRFLLEVLKAPSADEKNSHQWTRGYATIHQRVHLMLNENGGLINSSSPSHVPKNIKQARNRKAALKSMSAPPPASGDLENKELECPGREKKSESICTK